MAIKVKLRQKVISKGRSSLYLDFYPAIIDMDRGLATRRQFLGLYVYDKPMTSEEKLHNRNTQQIAEQIRNLRENQINKQEIYSSYELEKVKQREKSQKDFVEYFLQLTNARHGSNSAAWMSSYMHLKKFSAGKKTRFCDIDAGFIQDYISYIMHAKSLKKNQFTEGVEISRNTKASYLFKFKAALKRAYRDGYMEKDLSGQFGQIKTDDVRRLYLTIEELNSLVRTDCRFPILKTASIFSALTGLRFSDIEKLTWKEIEFIEGGGWYLVFRQKKTQSLESMPLSDQAVELIGEPKDPETKVFPNLKYSSLITQCLRDWAKSAGIKKPLTFHCFRHTFATLQFNTGTDIYTVSKLLGHKELKTTQVYVKLMDSTKREAVNKIRIDFPKSL
jgi:integrase